LKNRVKLMPDPEKMVVKRILQELEGVEKHKIFVEA
jgi:predicted nucleic acid-binding OB-fold protein